MSALFDWLVLPMQYPFMQRALIIALITGTCCAVLSCYLVLKGWSLMGDAVSHAVLPGMVIATMVGLPVALGAFVAGLFCAVATGWLQANSRVKSDTIMGIVFSGMFGLGLVLLTKADTDQHLMHVLFGNLLGVSHDDILETAVLGGACLGFVLLFRRDLLVMSFDPGHARVIGLPTGFLHYGLLTALALTIVVSLKAVGVILVVAMLIAPGAVAFLLTNQFERMLLVATVVSVFSAVAGTLVSFHMDAATSACIVLIQASIFVAVLFLAPKRGLLAARRQRGVRAAVA
ncbi:MAG: metal ABC transporter permease [Acetobacteraceae bacterium]